MRISLLIVTTVGIAVLGMACDPVNPVAASSQSELIGSWEPTTVRIAISDTTGKVTSDTTYKYFDISAFAQVNGAFKNTQTIVTYTDSVATNYMYPEGDSVYYTYALKYSKNGNVIHYPYTDSVMNASHGYLSFDVSEAVAGLKLTMQETLVYTDSMARMNNLKKVFYELSYDRYTGTVPPATWPAKSQVWDPYANENPVLGKRSGNAIEIENQIKKNLLF